MRICIPCEPPVRKRTREPPAGLRNLPLAPSPHRHNPGKRHSLNFHHITSLAQFGYPARSVANSANVDYRLKDNLIPQHEDGQITTGEAAAPAMASLRHATFNESAATTHIGILHEPSHPEPWIIAACRPHRTPDPGAHRRSLLGSFHGHGCRENTSESTPSRTARSLTSWLESGLRSLLYAALACHPIPKLGTHAHFVRWREQI